MEEVGKRNSVTFKKRLSLFKRLSTFSKEKVVTEYDMFTIIFLKKGEGQGGRKDQRSRAIFGLFYF